MGQEFRGRCKEGQASILMSGFIRSGIQTLSGEGSFFRNKRAVSQGVENLWSQAKPSPAGYLDVRTDLSAARTGLVPAGQHGALQAISGQWPGPGEPCHLLRSPGGEGHLRCPVSASHRAFGCGCL